MKLVLITICSLLISQSILSQNVGISVNNPNRAKLEVWGASGVGKTAALFGGDRGVSLHRNYAGIGMNQYFDNNANGRYMGSGYAAVWQYVHDDPGLSQGLSLTLFPNGATDALTPAGTRVWNFTMNNRFQILTTGAGGSGIIDIGRGTGGEGTAVFMGTTYHSFFNNNLINGNNNENTYISGGKGTSHVYINDIANGKVIFGLGSTTVGINTNGYIPPTTLEVRQSNGGMELTNTFRTDLPWEWRVTTGGSANFQILLANSVRTYFSYVDGSLHPISDARVKTNIQPLDPVLDKIMQLQPVTYMMKDAVPGQRRSTGLLAQNVQRYFPTLVSTGMNDTPDLLGVNYGGFNVIAIKGIQEEQAQIDGLEKGLNDIESRLQAIEKKLGNR